MKMIGKLTPKLSLHGTISKTAEVIGSNIQPLTVRNNGTYEASNGVDGFNPIYVNTPEPKEEQEKIVDIIENGTVEVLPDGNKALSKVTIKSNVPDTSGIIEDVIDNSGVLEDTDGTISITEKVEKLIDKAEEVDVFRCAKGIKFSYAKTFPSKAVISLPYITDLHQAFANWSTEPIPIVEELTLNVPNIIGMTQTFLSNSGVKKIILNGLDKCKNMSSAFHASSVLEEVVINFSTKNVTNYASSFQQTYKLKKIIGTLDFSSATNVRYMFDNCNSLEEMRFEPNTLSLSISLARSSKLTSESVQSIIDGLATVTTAQTLTLHKNIVLTDEQKSIINAKGWTLAQ